MTLFIGSLKNYIALPLSIKASKVMTSVIANGSTIPSETKIGILRIKKNWMLVANALIVIMKSAHPYRAQFIVEDCCRS